MIDLIPQFIFNGLLIGAGYALIAVGLTMIFGIMNIANFAHGEFYMLGGCVAFFFTSKLGFNYLLAIPPRSPSSRCWDCCSSAPSSGG